MERDGDLGVEKLGGGGENDEEEFGKENERNETHFISSCCPPLHELLPGTTAVMRGCAETHVEQHGWALDALSSSAEEFFHDPLNVLHFELGR